MDGAVTPGWYDHPQLGLIKIFQKNHEWVYVCYSHNGEKALSRPKPIDQWLWALSKPNKKMADTDNI